MSFVLRFALLICPADKAAYPHFNIYPSWVRALAPPVRDAPLPKKTRKSHKELHDEVAPYLPTVVPESPTATDKVTRRPRGLTIVAQRQKPAEEHASPPILKVSPLRKRVPSTLIQLDGLNPSPPRPRVSPVFDSFPSIEARLSRKNIKSIVQFSSYPKRNRKFQKNNKKI